MRDLLIGHNGFVGSTLSRQRAFDVMLNSKTIDGAAGSSFGTVVCAAAPGSMFEANRFPERDAERIDQIIAQIGRIGAKRFVLVSTIAVLKGFAALDERTTDFEEVTPYGVNRRRLEAFVTQQYPRALVVRLPALFGAGLKKNFLFDIRNPVPSMLTADKLVQLEAGLPADLAAVVGDIYDWSEEYRIAIIDRNRLERSGKRAALEEVVTGLDMSAVLFANPASRYQFYDMSRLWRDIGIALDHDLATLHLAPEPVEAGTIFTAVSDKTMPESSARVHTEDMRTAYAAMWNREGPYMIKREDVIDRIRHLFATQALT
jgi:hypothetical protein